MAISTETVGTLNDLTQICLNGEQGFAEASEHVADSALKLELSDYSLQRRDFAADLQSLVESSGEMSAQHGSVAAALHRTWMGVKSAVGGDPRHEVLAECERGEDEAVEAYEKALNAALPLDYQQLVQSQFSAVKRTHDRIKSLRDEAASKRSGSGEKP